MPRSQLVRALQMHRIPNCRGHAWNPHPPHEDEVVQMVVHQVDVPGREALAELPVLPDEADEVPQANPTPAPGVQKQLACVPLEP